MKAAHAELVDRGVEVSEVQVLGWFSFAFFSDPMATDVSYRRFLCAGRRVVRERCTLRPSVRRAR